MDLPGLNKIILFQRVALISFYRLCMVTVYQLHDIVIQSKIQMLIKRSFVRRSHIIPGAVNLIPLSIQLRRCPHMSVSGDPSRWNTDLIQKHHIGSVI